MTYWDERILRHWAREIHVEEAALHGPGLTLRFTSQADDRAVVYTFETRQVAFLPPRFERLLQGQSFETVDAARGFLSLKLALKWRDFAYYATSPVEVEPNGEEIRVLTRKDAAALGQLQGECTESELIMGQISIDDPLVVGFARQGKLVGVASLLDKGGDIFDIGVLTHPAARGQGIGAALTVYLRNDLTRRGKVAQYLTMEKNRGSVRVAEKSGFDLFAVEEGYTLSV